MVVRDLILGERSQYSMLDRDHCPSFLRLCLRCRKIVRYYSTHLIIVLWISRKWVIIAVRLGGDRCDFKCDFKALQPTPWNMGAEILLHLSYNTTEQYNQHPRKGLAILVQFHVSLTYNLIKTSVKNITCKNQKQAEHLISLFMKSKNAVLEPNVKLVAKKLACIQL